MAIQIECCPFCDSHYLHLSHHLLSHSVVCQSCKASGPHRKNTEQAIAEWNDLSKRVRDNLREDDLRVHGRLHELEDAVRNLAKVLRHDAPTSEPWQGESKRNF